MQLIISHPKRTIYTTSYAENGARKERGRLLVGNVKYSISHRDWVKSSKWIFHSIVRIKATTNHDTVSPPTGQPRAASQQSQ